MKLFSLYFEVSFLLINLVGQVTHFQLQSLNLFHLRLPTKFWFLDFLWKTLNFTVELFFLILELIYLLLVLIFDLLDLVYFEVYLLV